MKTVMDASGRPPSQRTTIGVAVVEHAGRYLIGVRGAGAVLAGKAEFPGGKCEPGETPRDAAVRECLEETGLAVVPIELLLEKSHDYPHGAVHLAFWRCRPANPSDVRQDHHGFQWVAAATLRSLDFPEANAEVVRMLPLEENDYARFIEPAKWPFELMDSVPAVVFNGRWEERSRFNVPGPIYGALTDTCVTGPAEAPANILTDRDRQEFVFRPPGSVSELVGIVRAAYFDPFEGYGVDGNQHWTREAVREYWRNRNELTSLIAHFALDRPNWIEERQLLWALGTWQRFIDAELRAYLRAYTFFLESGRVPTEGDRLPDLDA